MFIWLFTTGAKRGQDLCKGTSRSVYLYCFIWTFVVLSYLWMNCTLSVVNGLFHLTVGFCGPESGWVCWLGQHQAQVFVRRLRHQKHTAGQLHSEGVHMYTHRHAFSSSHQRLTVIALMISFSITLNLRCVCVFSQVIISTQLMSGDPCFKTWVLLLHGPQELVSVHRLYFANNVNKNKMDMAYFSRFWTQIWIKNQGMLKAVSFVLRVYIGFCEWVQCPSYVHKEYKRTR